MNPHREQSARARCFIFGMLPFVKKTASILFIAGVITSAALPAALLSSFQQQAAPQPSGEGPIPGAVQVAPAQAPLGRAALSVAVLDPAHGGTDPGARGGGGIHESDLVLAFAGQIKDALEKQGLRVILTRTGNEDPSFDDRATQANSQRGGIFITLHVGSTGIPGTARVYTLPDNFAGAGAPSARGATGPGSTGTILPWDTAQATFLPLSRKLADAVQGELALQFKGSPNTALTASVRQLRAIAAPAIAIELSSVSVENRAEIDRMGPGVADAVARAVAAFKPVYDAAPGAGVTP